MKLLVDTHGFLWFVADDPKLSAPAKAYMEDPGNELFVSIASLWEIAIKVGIGKLHLAEPYDVFIPKQLQINRIGVLDIKQSHVEAILSLPFHHKDPFDRMLVAQCLVEGLPLVSADSVFDRYGITRLW